MDLTAEHENCQGKGCGKSPSRFGDAAQVHYYNLAHGDTATMEQGCQTKLQPDGSLANDEAAKGVVKGEKDWLNVKGVGKQTPSSTSSCATKKESDKRTPSSTSSWAMVDL